VAVQITGGERKRQDAPPVEPDAGNAGCEVEPQGSKIGPECPLREQFLVTYICR